IMHRSFILSTLIILLIFMIVPLQADEATVIQISEWLKLGPVEQHFPAFHNQNNINGNPIKLADLLKFSNDDVTDWKPASGKMYSSLKWNKVSADNNGKLILAKDKNGLSIFYLAAYVKTDRWIKSELKVASAHPFEVFLDGSLLESKLGSENLNNGKDKETANISKEIMLERGSHLILIKTINDPENTSDWSIETSIQPKDSTLINDFAISTSPEETMTMEKLLDSPAIKDINISADGKIAAIKLSRILKPTEKSETWYEFRDTKSGQIIRELRGGIEISNFQWAPKENLYAYTSSGNDGKNLWIADFDNGDVRLLLENVKGFSGYQWAPDNSFIIYSVTEEYTDGPKDLNKLMGMEDRWPWWRNRSYLYRVDVTSGQKERLTGGLYSTDLNDISPDGKELIFSITTPNPSERPYSKNYYYRLNLKTLKADSLFAGNWGGSAQYSPDGKTVLLLAGPSFFGKLGVNISDDKIPNEYDTQAFLYNLKTGSTEAISRNFNPEINSAVWHKQDGKIYFFVTEKSYRNLYQYNPKNENYKKLDLQIEVLDNLSIASNSEMALYSGSSANQPEKLYSIDLGKNKSQLVLDPAETEYKTVQFGNVDRWTFKNKDNIEIEGRIYFPPGFDASKKYPCILYYYGGTSPVDRGFGGRYPKNFWAANGYIVYVMQPSGATGFGQDFSALHVNDWGKIVADEIILGVNKFLDAHNYVDRKRVGSIGASFGGFMTMLLQTKTDIFACAISHAGISSISSYWGEGYWGYLYSGVATANSFPWNRKDIYIDQSPLFSADKITTPLLLLHGKVDTNVPPGESYQLFTALKLLGREVELIEVAGQDHHIMEYNKRKEWSKTIVAWFDKYLKDQPQWWQDLYPDK
ncbi:MAG: S9 family peptidase, partial [Calditrichaceae bacterium]